MHKHFIALTKVILECVSSKCLHKMNVASVVPKINGERCVHQALTDCISSQLDLIICHLYQS